MSSESAVSSIDHAAGRLALPADVMSEAQLALAELQDAGEASERFDQVIDRARRQLDEYYDHRPSAEKSSKREQSPLETACSIERTLAGIPSGVLARGAVFESLALATSGMSMSDQLQQMGTDPVAYECSEVSRYWAGSGEDHFLTALVRRLDHGIQLHYRKEYTRSLRSGLRDCMARLEEAKHRAGGSPSTDAATLDFDPWTIDADSLLRTDSGAVREHVRRVLRHIAETAMQFVRMLPVCIMDAYEDRALPLPRMSIDQLQDCFARALPVFVVPAGMHLRGSVETLSDRRDSPFLPGELIAEVVDGELEGFRWRHPAASRPSRAGRCPANSTLPGLSQEEQKVIARIRNAGDATMSTAEAFLRLAGVETTALWVLQYEAHQICPELNNA